MYMIWIGTVGWSRSNHAGRGKKMHMSWSVCGKSRKRNKGNDSYSTYVVYVQLTKKGNICLVGNRLLLWLLARARIRRHR